MRDILGLILFFVVVGLVQVLFTNAVWKAARKGLPETPDRRDEPARAETLERGRPSVRRRLPGLLLRLLPDR